MTLPARAPRPWYRQVYAQVLLATVLGILIGYLFPEVGKALKPLGDAFVKLVRMIIAPIIFCTVVHGIASASDARKLGRIGVKALVYFEVVSSLALVLGLIVVNVWKPGAGFNVDPARLDPGVARGYAERAHAFSATDFLLNIIPRSFFDAFATGDLLQVLLISVLTGLALVSLRERGRPMVRALGQAEELFFGIMRIIVRAAPLAALGAMAFTVGSFGLGAIGRLAALMLAFYTTALLFVALILGMIARVAGFSLARFLGYIKDELTLVLGTSSSETAMPGLMEKLRRLGCAESTVGFVIPLGYSFNLDGTNIYMTLAAVFLAQATNTHLTLGQQLGLLLVTAISSKGASGVTGAGFVTLAATLAAVPSIPLTSLALLVGIDRFMSECRALTNVIGNGVATVVISRWEREVTPASLRAALSGASAARHGDPHPAGAGTADPAGSEGSPSEG